MKCDYRILIFTHVNTFMEYVEILVAFFVAFITAITPWYLNWIRDVSLSPSPMQNLLYKCHTVIECENFKLLKL